MDIKKELNGTSLVVEVSGRMDSSTAPQLERVFTESLGDVTSLTVDFADLAYLSSAGLRVLLAAQKTMNKQGSMVVRNVNDEVMDVFEITGFVDILTIE